MSGANDRRLTRCKICGGESPLFALVDSGKTCSREEPYPFGLLGKPVYYAKCHDCAFVFTEHFDVWSTSRWSAEIYNADYKIVDPDFLYLRPKANAEWLARTVHTDLRNVDVLDFGSGNGETEKFLRSYGFDHVESFDPVFHPAAPDGKFDLVTAFEVVEHSTDPVGSFRQMIGFMKPEGLLVFQTCLTPADLAAVRSGWWYMSPRNGHVSFYSVQSLQVLARLNGLILFTDGVVSCMYYPDIESSESIKSLRLVESFVGWTKPDCDYVVLAQGAWHYQEEIREDGSPFRWTSATHGSTLAIVYPTGLTGTFTITITVVMTADGVDGVAVLPLGGDDVEVVSSFKDGSTYRFVMRAEGARRVRLSVATSAVAVPANGDPRSLGVALLRPVLTF